MSRGLIVLLLFFPITAFAQFTYAIDQSIPVEVNDRDLAMPWAGGLNSAQVNTMDFDGDGKQDVVVFDRAADKLMLYRNTGAGYECTPDYEALFPPSVSQWMLLRDFNCDGKKDLFTSDPFGISVFVNTTKTGQALSWRPFNPGRPLLTKGFNGNINLKINDVDIPAIDDVDNDGDLDILSMRFVGIGTVEWHKNMSMEKTGACDSLQLERVTQSYGGVQECFCGVFTFGGQPCPTDGGRIEHVGGKALLSIDIDADGDRELLYSEETCSPLFMFRNDGDKNNPSFNSSQLFPTTTPALFPLFPAAFFEDVDFDGLKDLVVSPNLYSRQYTNIIVKNSVWFYKNTGTAQTPAFTFSKDNFLQEDMIDVGDYSTPALFDADNDGDEDLFVGVYANESFRGSVYLFENIGTSTAPAFHLRDEDYGGLSVMLTYNIKLQFADVNADAKPDFVFTATSLQDGTTQLYYVPNTGQTGLTLNFNQLKTTAFRLGQPENLRVADVNSDGIPDILIGKATGALQYWENRVDNGLFNSMDLKDGTYLGLGNSTSRQNPAVFIADLDADGLDDLLMADQTGKFSLYGDFRSFDPDLAQPASDVVYNGLTKDYGPGNFGGRIYPAVGNLFNSNKPAIVLGNTLGGLYVLRNDSDVALPEEPVVGIGPSPLKRDEELLIRSDRNTRVQIFSLLGQKMSEQVTIPANQNYPLALKEMAAGMYVARFTFSGKNVSVKFVLRDAR
ncbi:MAG TPA: T9SS type A sorting domain-containing protein [Cyclobacteriaceae bacterium]|nr:T9SS type A sorting domain-containing protein [Cyclobacteriaceae bacterium]